MILPKITEAEAEELTARHTKGPLIVIEGEQYCFHDTTRVSIQHEIKGDEGTAFITVAEVWPGDNDIDIIDGHRLADCYNACLNMADPAAEITRLRQDKAELVAVVEDELEYLLDEKQGDEMVRMQLDVRIAKHKAALAKGGKGV